MPKKFLKTLVEKFGFRNLMKHHCIINQVSLFGKSLKMQHVMKTVVKFINKIRAKELIHTKFKEYCKILEIENDNLIIFGN